ncbi:MAG TPA: glycoside hydrolase family 130 protein [Armatimonadota bacterium]
MTRTRPLAALIALCLLTCAARAADERVPAWGLGPFIKVDAANPVLGPKDSLFLDPMSGRMTAWEKDNVFNPAAVVRNGRLCVLYRAEDDSGDGIGKHTSRIGLAVSTDAKNFRRLPTPALYPGNDDQKAYDWPGGCEDPRLVETEEGGYILTYTAWNRQTARLCVATSPDLVRWTKRGSAFARAGGGRYRDAWSKSASIVCRLKGDRLIAARIGGKLWMYWGEGQVHVASSLNGTDWEPVTDAKGELLTVLAPRAGLFDSNLTEPGPPALLTEKGIVLLYNGKNDPQRGDPSIPANAYSAGQALFDASNPARLLARTDKCFLTPQRPYELSGQYQGGTVFIEGLVRFHGRWWLYYGTADSHVAVARTEG